MDTCKIAIRLLDKYVEPADGLSERESGWWPAGISAANEILALNSAAIHLFLPTEATPEYISIPANPDTDRWETLLGMLCSPPNDKGMVNIMVNRAYLDPTDLPAIPKSFVVLWGQPPVGDLKG